MNSMQGDYRLQEKAVLILRRISRKYKIILQAMIAGISLLTCLVHQMPMGIGVVFFIFQFFCVYMQGMLILSGLRISLPDEISKTAYYYGVGFIMLIPEYYIFQMLHIGKLSWILALLMGIDGCVYLYLENKKAVACGEDKNSSAPDENKAFGWTLCLFCLFLIYVVDFLTVSLVTTLPNENGRNGYYVDWLFWIGNAISSLKGIPIQDFRLAGADFRYYYFSSIVVAQISQMTGIDVTIVGFYFSYILVAVVMAFAAYALFHRFTEKKILLALCMLLMFFTGDRGVTCEWHYFFCPFGYDYGMATGLLTIFYLFLKRSEKWEARDIVLSSVLIAATTGYKGPIAVIILVGFGMEGLWLLIHKKFKTAFIAGTAWLGSFVAMYYVFIASRSRNLTQTYYGIKKAFEKNVFGMETYSNILKVVSLPSPIAKLLALFLSIITTNRAVLVCFFIALIVYIIRRKLIRYEQVTLMMIVAAGIYLTSAFLMDGSSQMYFAMAALPYAVCFSIPAFEDLFGTKNWGIKLAAGAAIGYSLAFGVQHWEISFEKLAWQGINTVKGNLTYEDYTDEYKYSYAGSFYITEDFMEVYDWIKENTEEDCVIAAHGGRGNLLAGVFTQRFIWNDGTYCIWTDEVDRRNEIISMLDNRSTYDEGIEELRRSGVTYYLEGIQPGVVSLSDERLEKVFSNNIMAVYRID